MRLAGDAAFIRGLEAESLGALKPALYKLCSGAGRPQHYVLDPAFVSSDKQLPRRFEVIGLI